jgi:hypothetical protein
MRRMILSDVIPLTKVGVGQVVTYAHWGNEEEDTYICHSTETHIITALSYCGKEEDTYMCQG